MPTDTTADLERERKAFAHRLDMGMKHAGYGYRGGKTAFAKRYGVRPPVVTEWLGAQYIPEYPKVRTMATEFGCSPDWLYSGNGGAPEWFNGPVRDVRSEPATFTKERRANDDVVALQIALESLTLAVCKLQPGAAVAFVADMEAVAHEKKFSSSHGLLAKLAGIAKGAANMAAAEARPPRRAGSVRRTKP